MRIHTATVVLALVVLGCGPDDAGSTSTPSIPPTTIIAMTAHGITDGVFSGPGTFEVAIGDPFSVTVVADTADVLHVHGYDLAFDLEPGVPVTVEFQATVPGTFDVELEEAGIHLFQIEVRG